MSGNPSLCGTCKRRLTVISKYPVFICPGGCVSCGEYYENNNNVCPVCVGGDPKIPLSGLTLFTVVSNLMTGGCRFPRCPVKPTVRSYRSHLGNCGYASVVCSVCGGNALRKDFHEHLEGCRLMRVRAVYSTIAKANEVPSQKREDINQKNKSTSSGAC